MRARLGHDRAGRFRTMSVLLDTPPRSELLSELSRGEARRVARYGEVVRQLLYQGRYRGAVMTPARFRRVVGTWRPIRGERFLSDPDAVVALIDELRADDQELFVYERARS